MAAPTLPAPDPRMHCACGLTVKQNRLGRAFTDVRDKCPVCGTFATDHDYNEGGEGRCGDCDIRAGSHPHRGDARIHSPNPSPTGLACLCGWTGTDYAAYASWHGRLVAYLDLPGNRALADSKARLSAVRQTARAATR